MSTIWTPSGERPVGADPATGPMATGPPSTSGPPPVARPPAEPPDDMTEEELAAEMAEVQRQLADTPAAVVVANHCIGLFQLAALHLNRETPALAEAKLAIDALAAIVEGLAGRLGDNEEPLRDALTQIRLAFVQVSAS